jgi:hypothetical protein
MDLEQRHVRILRQSSPSRRPIGLIGEPSDTPTATRSDRRPGHRNGEPRTPPELVSAPSPTPTARRERAPSSPSTGPAREQAPGDDRFDEPGAQPKTVTARSPPDATVRNHRSANRNGTISDTSP